MIRFGPSGNDTKFYEDGFKSSLDAPKWLHDMGLTAYEINFGHGIRMSLETAQKMGENARAYNISISIHAPYFINLATDDQTKIKKSYEYISKCLEIAKTISASDGPAHLVVHIGSQCELEREAALEYCKKNLAWAAEQLQKNGFSNFLLCIETMGRYKAIGNYKEICDLCTVADCVIPTIDFGHINALEQGELKRNPERAVEIMQYCMDKLGKKMQNVHIHFSSVAYTEKGERVHTALDDEKWSFSFENLARFIKEKKLEPIIVCESDAVQARDALKLAKQYEIV